jgi:hypothetical protein
MNKENCRYTEGPPNRRQPNLQVVNQQDALSHTTGRLSARVPDCLKSRGTPAAANCLKRLRGRSPRERLRHSKK